MANTITKGRLEFADTLVLHMDTRNWSSDISADQVEYSNNLLLPVHISHHYLLAETISNDPAA